MPSHTTQVDFEIARAHEIKAALGTRIRLAQVRPALDELARSRPDEFTRLLCLIYGVRVEPLDVTSDAPEHLSRFCTFLPAEDNVLQMPMGATYEEAERLACDHLKLAHRFEVDCAHYQQELSTLSAGRIWVRLSEHMYSAEVQQLMAEFKEERPDVYRELLCLLFGVTVEVISQELHEEDPFVWPKLYEVNADPAEFPEAVLVSVHLSEKEAVDEAVALLALEGRYSANCAKVQHTGRRAGEPAGPVDSAQHLWASFKDDFTSPESLTLLRVLQMNRPALFNRLVGWYFGVAVFPIANLPAAPEHLKDKFHISAMGGDLQHVPMFEPVGTEDEAYATAVQKLHLVERLWPQSQGEHRFTA